MNVFASWGQSGKIARTALIIAALIAAFTILTPTSAEVLLQATLTPRVYLPAIGKSEPPGFYVAPNGNDSNPGTAALPWKTIGKAAKTVAAGQTVYVRAGTYQESLIFNISGTADAPVRIVGYPGETPVIDGKFQLPTGSSALVHLKGNWIYFSGFEVRNSTYIGVQLGGQHVKVDHVYSHHHMHNGIWVQGDYGTVENCQLTQNSFRNENNKLGNGSSALTTARDTLNGTTDYGVLRNNVIWENWGIGIDSYESNGTLIESNIVHDNLIGNIYVSDATNVITTRNYVYMTPGSITYGKSANFGIMLGDEKYTPPSANNQVINNIAYGNNKNFTWSHVREVDGMNNVLIANNIFVNSMPNTNGNRNVDISDGIHKNVRFFNNIIIQDDSQAIEDIRATSGFTFSHNIWSKAPRASNLGTGDIVGDPKISRTGTPFTIDWFRITSTSPARNYAVPLVEVAVDYSGILRDNSPDVGPLEFVP